MTDEAFEYAISNYGHNDDQAEYLREIHIRNQSKFERLQHENMRIDRMLDVLTEFVKKIAQKENAAPAELTAMTEAAKILGQRYCYEI